MSNDEQAGEQKDGTSESRWCELYKTEDYWAIWLGLAIIIIGLLVFLPHPPEGMQDTIQSFNDTMQREADAAPFRTIAWYKANDAKGKLKATGGDVGPTLGKIVGKPHGWSSNPVEAFASRSRPTCRSAAFRRRLPRRRPVAPRRKSSRSPWGFRSFSPRS
jgi:hypothetical protein